MRRYRRPSTVATLLLLVIAFASGCKSQSPEQQAYAARLQYNALGSAAISAQQQNIIGDDAFLQFKSLWQGGEKDVSAMEQSAKAGKSFLNFEFARKSDTVKALLAKLVEWAVNNSVPPTPTPPQATQPHNF